MYAIYVCTHVRIYIYIYIFVRMLCMYVMYVHCMYVCM